MRIYGLDFTSAPGRRKPITRAECDLEDDVLLARNLSLLESFEEFEDFLSRGGDWVAGMDFPFGQPKEAVEELGWPRRWEKYVGKVARLSKAEFEAAFREYSSRQVRGKMHPKREVDELSNAQSPMKLDFVPVGKMFFRGAPRLLHSELDIVPCRQSGERRKVVEAYPALVARKFVGRRSYKSERKDTPERRTAREDIVAGLSSFGMADRYGFTVEIEGSLANELVEDRSGDNLDAVLCAAQAAWAYKKRGENYGVPAGCDREEGWIPDPELLESLG